MINILTAEFVCVRTLQGWWNAADTDTTARATGLGFALAVRRISAIIVPIPAVALPAMIFQITSLSMLAAISMLIAAGAVFLLDRLRRIS